MGLPAPPGRAALQAMPACDIVGVVVHRVYRHDAVRSPWFFSSAPGRAGRFDLPHPLGSCYVGTSRVAAVLEAFQGFSGLLPVAELRGRRRVQAQVPIGAPRAADLASRASRGAGVTAALWAGGDRALTQGWARALYGAGWEALHHGIQHDPSGSERALTFFGPAGEHLPFGLPEWVGTSHTLHDDVALATELARYGVRVTADPEPWVVPLDETGLLEE